MEHVRDLGARSSSQTVAVQIIYIIYAALSGQEVTAKISLILTVVTMTRRECE